ncbi:MAG TPA: GGDEF domain-containing protein, partial [Candidatus Hydrogenedentes bacterium]|nr:GGDEF domain-containing protein [Candidatus Hydrogenedentota bacterium]
AEAALRQNTLALDQSKLAVHALLQSVTESLETLLQGSAGYGDTLEEHKAAIRKALDTAAIREWQEAMESELEKMQSSNAQYLQQLDSANQKLRDQQEELVRLQSDVGMDFLTKIPNRRSFDKRVAEEMNRAERYGGTFSMVVFDVDHFKYINDTYGHLAGDRILRALAKVLDEQRRASDFLARYGGEEFVLLLPQTDVEQARLVAESTREKLDRCKFRCEDHSIRVTVSAGVGELSPGTDTPESLFGRVDSALYAAKESGRNRVEVVYFEAVSG